MSHDRDLDDGIRGQYMYFSTLLLVPAYYFVLQLHTDDIVLLKCFVYVYHLQMSDQLRL